MQAQCIARLHLRSVRGDGTWQGYKIAYVTFWAQSSFVLKRTPVCYGHQQSPLLSLNALCLKKHKTMEGQLDACARQMLISPRIREVSPGELETCSCVKSKEDYHILTYVYGEERPRCFICLKPRRTAIARWGQLIWKWTGYSDMDVEDSLRLVQAEKKLRCW